ncbi:MAG: prolyl oligopeptidase family serine peptidase, partial [Acidobacteriota bacterium]
AYTFQSIQWAPDSTKLAAYRRVPGYNRQVSYVQSSPTDQLQPKASSRFYRKPGDTVDIDTPVLFAIEGKKQTIVDNTLFPNPYSNQRIEWRKDSRAFTFEYNQRGHQVYRVIEVDAATGKARTVIEETSRTFIDYRRTTAGLTDCSRMERFDIGDGQEVIWMSERDGWAHLYLYDGVTGQVKQQITKGHWPVHHVEKVDEAKRQIWFTANGVDAGKDPYFLNWYRVNFDGTGLTRFTTADAMHNVTWSPDQQYYVDSYSRVDQAPVAELRRTSDQSLVLELEKADTTDLLATGWKAPEVFMSKARDGVTDIWGIIIRPTNFDPKKKYPVIENIYAGPQGSFVPKTFSTQTGMQTLAELGFIVVQIDGMGTANRSKAFHDVAWKDLADAGFPDRILWHKAVAAKYPYYDITKVGIYGTSAGGQNSAGGLLFHPEFYKVAVSNSGCHDNRMDKIWWNEQWMGWPIGPEYAASSNVDHAAALQGHLMLVVPELDTNVDPSSTMQVVNALVKASKEFELVVVPGADHGAGSPITVRKRNDFFMRYLRGIEPPNWNIVTVSAQSPGGGAFGVDPLEEDEMPWVASEDWELIRG